MAGRRPVDPIVPLALVTLGALAEVIGGYWDVYSHAIQRLNGFPDPPLNPAHLAIYAATSLVVLGALVWIRRGTAVPEIRSPMGVVTLGTAMQLAAGMFNEAWHRLGGPLMTLEPPHVLLVLGMVVGTFGAITALGTLRGVHVLRGEPVPWTLHGLLLLAFLAMWLTTAGSAIYIAYALGDAGARAMLPIVAAIAPLVLIPCLRTLPVPGALTLLGAGYAAVNWVLLVGYLGGAVPPGQAPPPYVPWTIPAVAALEVVGVLAMRSLGPAPSALLTGVASGLLFYWIFYPFTADLVDRGVLQVLSPGVVLGSFVGGVLAHLILRWTVRWVTQGRGVPTTAAGVPRG